MALSRPRLEELRANVDAGTVSWSEVAELQEAFEEIPEDELPEPRENASFGDMLDELEARLPRPYTLHYTSADAPGPGSTWSVYAEDYASKDDAEPIPGTTRRVATYMTEAEADRQAERAQKALGQ